jgi:hypothetical protein
MPRQAILVYYAATLLFLLLDVGFNINLRIAFLEPLPLWRAAYYGVCFVCLALILWQPAWTVIVSAFESLVTLIALILTMGLRTLTISDAVLEGSASFVRPAEIFNFLLSGAVAYLSWTRGMQELFRR